MTVDFENFCILVLFREPGYADKLVGENNIRNGVAFILCQMCHAVIAANDIPVDFQPLPVILSEGFRQHRSGGIAGIVDPGISF